MPGTCNLRQHGQFCYELRRDAPADWVHASKDCFSYANGFMVQIMSQKDQDFIMQFLREEKVRVPIWIGLTDKGDEEHFYWDSGKPKCLYLLICLYIYDLCLFFSSF